MTSATLQPRKLVLIVGNSRSGTTIVGSIIDSHPNMLCANESKSSSEFWRNRTGAQIIEEIVENSRANSEQNRPSEGYLYGIRAAPKAAIEVVADKVWNPSLLLLAGDSGLIERLSEATRCPVEIINCVRNPFDVIATMHKRSKAPLDDRARWFFMHCDATLSVEARHGVVSHVRNEDLIARPAQACSALFDALGYTASPAHLDTIQDRVAGTPSRTRADVEWPPELIEQIERRAKLYPFLKGYAFHS